MAGPGLPACAGGGLSRALGLAIWRYRTSPRALPRTGREGGGWRCPGVTARPCSQRPVPGRAPNRWRSGRAGLCRCYPGLGGTLSGAAGVPLPGQRRCPPLSAGQNPCAVPSPPGLAHLLATGRR